MIVYILRYLSLIAIKCHHVFVGCVMNKNVIIFYYCFLLNRTRNEFISLIKRCLKSVSRGFQVVIVQL